MSSPTFTHVPGLDVTTGTRFEAYLHMLIRRNEQARKAFDRRLTKEEFDVLLYSTGRAFRPALRGN